MSRCFALVLTLLLVSAPSLVSCTETKASGQTTAKADGRSERSHRTEKERISIFVGGGLTVSPGTTLNISPSGEASAEIDGESYNFTGKRELYERVRLLLQPFRTHATTDIATVAMHMSPQIPCEAMATDGAGAIVLWEGEDERREAINIYFGCQSAEVRAFQARILEVENLIRTEARSNHSN